MLRDDSFSLSSFFCYLNNCLYLSLILVIRLLIVSEIIKGEKYFTNNNRSQVADEWHLQIQFYSFRFCYLLEWHFFSYARFYWIHIESGFFYTWLRRRKPILRKIIYLIQWQRNGRIYVILRNHSNYVKQINCSYSPQTVFTYYSIRFETIFFINHIFRLNHSID